MQVGSEGGGVDGGKKAARPRPPDLPRHRLYMTLRDLWVEKRTTTRKGPRKGVGRGNGRDPHISNLCEELSTALGRNIEPARVSVWATGTDVGASGHGPPPWDVIRWLMEQLQLDLVVPGKGQPYFVAAKKAA